MSKITAKIFNIQGKEIREISLSEDLFGVKWSPDIVKQALVRDLANQRNTVAHTKTRGEVKGSKKKRWAQKHTGRARHGNGKTNIWRGGGTAFGPKSDRNFTKRLPKRQRKFAIFSLLTNMLNEGKVKFVANPDFTAPKSKQAVAAIEGLGLENKNLWILPSGDSNTFLSLRNIEGQTAIKPHSLNVRYLAYAKNVVIFEETLESIHNHFFGGSNEVEAVLEEVEVEND